MPEQTAEEIALARKYELLRKKKEQQAAKQREQKQAEQQDAHKKPAGAAAKPVVNVPTAGATKSAVSASAAARKAEAEPSKPLSAHEKALQALRAAKGSAGARTGIGQISRKRPAPAAAEADQQDAGQPAQKPEARAADSNGASTAATAMKSLEADSSKEKVDPVAAAKEALAAKTAVGQKQPGLKRPTAVRPAHAPSEHHDKRQRTDDGEGPSGREPARPGVQLFVGDLPVHWGPREVEELFGQIAPVLGARVMSPNCYGFVTFPTEEDVAFVLQAAETTGILAEGGTLRVSRAGAHKDAHQGLPPEERAARYTDYAGNQGEHPKVREARLAGRSLAQQIQTGQLPGMACGPPPERALVCYDDL